MLGLALGQLGRIALARKETAAGRAMIGEAIENLRNALEANPDNPGEKLACRSLSERPRRPRLRWPREELGTARGSDDVHSLLRRLHAWLAGWLPLSARIQHRR